MRWLAIALAGCASAGSGNAGVDSNSGGGGDGGGGGNTDSGMTMSDGSVTMPDGSVGPQTRTLTQTTSQTIKALNSIACSNQTTGYTRANSYYRVFDLPAMGINSAFTVQKVSFQVEHCDHVNNTGCVVAVRVGTYNGTPGATLPGSITVLASNASVAVPEIIENQGPPPTTPGGTVDAPISATIPAGSKLVVQVDALDGDNLYAFFIGTNDGGESGFGYISSSTCSIATPTNISTVGTAAPRHMLLTATGTY